MQDALINGNSIFPNPKCKHFPIGNRPLDCRPYFIDGNNLEKVSECRDRGVIIDDKLRFILM
jgi:hypothetical protein